MICLPFKKARSYFQVKLSETWIFVSLTPAFKFPRLSPIYFSICWKHEWPLDIYLDNFYLLWTELCLLLHTNPYVKDLTPNLTVFEDRTSKEVIKVKWGYMCEDLIPQDFCLYEKRKGHQKSFSPWAYGRKKKSDLLPSTAERDSIKNQQWPPVILYVLWFSCGSPNNFADCLFTHGLKSWKNTDVQQIQTTGIWSLLRTDLPMGLSQFLFFLFSPFLFFYFFFLSSEQMFTSMWSVTCSFVCTFVLSDRALARHCEELEKNQTSRLHIEDIQL